MKKFRFETFFSFLFLTFPVLAPPPFTSLSGAVFAAPPGEIERLVLEGQYRQAITDFRLGEGLPPRDRFLLGVCYRETGEYQAAALIWGPLAEGPEAENALPALGDALMRAGETSRADTLFTRYRRDFPTGGSMPFVLLGQAEAREKLGRQEDARWLLTNLRRGFPFTPEAEEANRRLARMRGEFTLQLGNFSELARAESVARQLVENGFDAYLSRLAAEKLSYRVRSGNFPGREEAVLAGQSIREATGLDYFVTAAR